MPGTSVNAGAAGTGGAASSGGGNATSGVSSGSRSSHTALAAVTRAAAAADSSSAAVPAGIAKAAGVADRLPGAGAAGDTTTAGAGDGTGVTTPDASSGAAASGQPDTSTGDGTAGAGADGTAVADAAAVAGDGTQTGDGRNPAFESRIQSATRNARSQTVRAVFDELGLSLEPGADVRGTLREIREQLDVVRRMAANPRKFWQEFGAELGVGDSGGAGGTTDEREPEADLVTENNRKVYSAERMAQVWSYREKRLLESLRREFAPMRDFVTNAEQAEADRTENARLGALATSSLTAARNLPHFKEHEPEIQKRLIAMDPDLRSSVGAIAAMHMCYTSVLRDKVFPTINSQAEARIRDEYAKKAAATSVVDNNSTGGGVPSKVQPIKGIGGLAAHMAKLESSNDPRLTA